MAYYHSKYGYGRKRRKKSKWVKYIFSFLFILIILSGIAAYWLYSVLLRPNVWINGAETKSIYIPTGSNFDSVKVILYREGLIINRKNFEWVARNKNYPSMVKPGHYLIKENMNNLNLVNMLRAGLQEPVDVIFNNVRNLEQLASRISGQLEADSADIMYLLEDQSFISGLGFDSISVKTMFIPNTYEFYWNSTARQFIERMHTEYESFWNSDRRNKADSLGMSVREVVTLASIVEKETSKKSEKPTIAGVYINRLNRGWLMQADPTLIYAIGDYSIKRVLNKHKRVDSPYNTYLNEGLPPGPICIPAIESIDAVLNYEDHNYLFFCANADMSGYHVFTNSSAQHAIHARKFQRELDKLNIKK